MRCAPRSASSAASACAPQGPGRTRLPPRRWSSVGILDAEDAAHARALCKVRAATACNHTGYKGRVGTLRGAWRITDELRELILVGASALNLRKKGIEEGKITLRQSGLLKVKEGVTTTEEVTRETVK